MGFGLGGRWGSGQECMVVMTSADLNSFWEKKKKECEEEEGVSEACLDGWISNNSFSLPFGLGSDWPRGGRPVQRLRDRFGVRGNRARYVSASRIDDISS